MAALSLVLAIAFVAALFMSFTVGANSNSAPVAPAVGANALSVLRAGLLVGIVAGLGAILQGGNISETIGKGLVTGVSITPLAAAAALLTSATLITVGNSRGYPIPSAFTVTGSIVGVGIALGGGFATGEYVRIVGFWLAIPLANAALGYAIARALRSERITEAVGVPALAGGVGYAIANIHLAVLAAPNGGSGSIAGALSRWLGLPVVPLAGGYTLGMVAASVAVGLLALGVTRWQLARDETAGINRFLVVLGLIVVFTSGGSQVGLATGPLESIFSSNLHASTVYLLALGGIGILAGAWIRSPRVIQAVSNEYAALGPRRSIAALIPAFLVAQLAIALGIPISFNKVMISSIVGSGLAASSSGGGVSPRKAGITVASWVGSMGGAGVISYGLYLGLHALPGVAS